VGVKVLHDCRKIVFCPVGVFFCDLLLKGVAWQVKR